MLLGQSRLVRLIVGPDEMRAGVDDGVRVRSLAASLPQILLARAMARSGKAEGDEHAGKNDVSVGALALRQSTAEGSAEFFDLHAGLID